MRSGDDGGRCVGSGGGYIDGCGYVEEEVLGVTMVVACVVKWVLEMEKSWS